MGGEDNFPLFFLQALLPGGRIYLRGVSNSRRRSLHPYGWEEAIFDPATAQVHYLIVPSCPKEPPLSQLTVLKDGRFLFTGGGLKAFIGPQHDPPGIYNTAELCDPIRHQSKTIQMLHKRTRHMAILLKDGRVLIGGSQGDSFFWPILKSAELFSPE